MSISLIFVVFEYEDDGQLPHRRDIQRFVESSLLRSAVTKKAVDDLAGSLHLRGERGAGCMRDARADDPRSARKIVRRIGQMHRSAEAFADSVLAAVHLRHQISRRSPQHDG